MAAPRVLKSTDAGAPVIDGTSASLYNLLKKCLVDGYGTTDPLGWSLRFDDPAGFRAVFRNEGFGGEFRFQPATTGASAFGQMLAAASFTNISSPVGIIQGSSLMAKRGDSTSFTPYSTWFLIGDTKRFYLLTSIAGPFTGDSSLGATIFSSFVGDFESCVSDDPHRFVCSCSTSGSTAENYRTNITTTDCGIIGSNFKKEPGTGAYNPHSFWVGGNISGAYAPYRMNAVALSGNSSSASANLPLAAPGWYPLIPVFAAEAFAITSPPPPATNPLLRGRFPGLYSGAFSLEAPPMTQMEIAGRQYIGFQATEGSPAGCDRFVCISEDWP